MGLDLGIAPIGTKSVDLKAFESTNCSEKEHGMDDCSATDSMGRHYAFFDGALSMVSADAADTPSRLTLPGEMRFGEDIHEAAQKARNIFGIKFDLGNANGVTAYSSPMAIRSSAGILYSVELIADKDGHYLTKVVQRTDF
ncbi:MAG: hypothetical protein LCH59_11165 [Proteobacteria bacterium]|nr:hypothetical protein [Pseudomonadota bacterium]